jgi:L,D-transpeptidase catalytic domain
MNRNHQKIAVTPLGAVLCALAFFLLYVSAWAGGKADPSPCKITHPSDAVHEWTCRRLPAGKTLDGLFGDRWRDVARFNRVDRRHAYPGVSLKVPARLDDIRDYSPLPRHYQPAEQEAKFILVDLSEQFLGAYEYGQLVFSSPVATGEKTNKTPAGEFRITAYSRNHRSTMYFIENTTIHYPMHYGLRFHVNASGISYWIHGRDMPGYPASHGCIGLYDEAMQKQYYGYPKNPELEDARKLFEWAISPLPDDGKFHLLKNGPKVVIAGEAPLSQ